MKTLTLSAISCLRRSSMSFSTALLCSSCFTLRFWAFICSMRSSSASLANISCLKASSSSCIAWRSSFLKANCSSYVCLRSRRCLILFSISAYKGNSIKCRKTALDFENVDHQQQPTYMINLRTHLLQLLASSLNTWSKHCISDGALQHQPVFSSMKWVTRQLSRTTLWK